MSLHVCRPPLQIMTNLDIIRKRLTNAIERTGEGAAWLGG